MNIVPFYPLRVLSSEDYFKADLIYAFGNGKSTDKVRYFTSPWKLYKALPKNETLYCHGMTRKMVILYVLLRNTMNWKQLVPHTSFGKYPPWGFPINLFPLLTPLMKQFDMIRAISAYEYNYYKDRGFDKVYYEHLEVDKNHFKFIAAERNWTNRGVLCMGGDRAVKNVKTIIKACRIARIKLTIMDDVIPRSQEYDNAFIENNVFVSSSYMEGFSLGIAEAQACRMALCLSNLPTVKSEYGETALYHEPDDYDKLAKNISCCIGI